MFNFRTQFLIQLRYHREASGLNQQELAEKLHISLSTYQRFETGQSTLSLDMIYQLAKMLDFSLDEIFSPESIIESLSNIKIIRESEEQDFLNHPLVLNSKILELTQIDFTNGITEVTNHPILQNSPYYLMVTSFKDIFINDALKMRLGFNKNLISIGQWTDKICELGALWAYFISTGKRYIEEKRTKYFPAGQLDLIIRNFFVRQNNQFLCISVVEIL